MHSKEEKDSFLYAIIIFMNWVCRRTKKNQDNQHLVGSDKDWRTKM